MVLAYPFLALLHAIYSLVVASISLFRHLTRPTPEALKATRRRVPRHLAILFVPDTEFDERTIEHCIIESIQKSINWCQQVGVRELSVYDAEGIILSNVGLLRNFATPDISKNAEVDRRRINYPPTPPLSDYSESRPLSPQDDLSGHKPFLTLQTSPRQNASRSTISERCSYVLPSDIAPLDSKNQPLTLHILTRESSKPFVAAISHSVARTERRNPRGAIKDTFTLSVNSLESYLEGKDGLSPPDFMIIHPVHPSKYHRTPIELHGYPPWQIRLTEIYCNRFRKQYEGRLMWFLPSHVSSSLLSSSLTEWEFREALDQFATAEMRLGK